LEQGTALLYFRLSPKAFQQAFDRRHHQRARERMLHFRSKAGDLVGRYTPQIRDEHAVIAWERDQTLLQTVVIVAAVEVPIKDRIGFAHRKSMR